MTCFNLHVLVCGSGWSMIWLSSSKLDIFTQRIANYLVILIILQTPRHWSIFSVIKLYDDCEWHFHIPACSHKERNEWPNLKQNCGCIPHRLAQCFHAMSCECSFVVNWHWKGLVINWKGKKGRMLGETSFGGRLTSWGARRTLIRILFRLLFTVHWYCTIRFVI